MARIKATIRCEAGILLRGQLVRELQKACDSFHVTLIINEQKGWFESYFKFVLIGEEMNVKRINNWLQSI